jgi:diketogulonate reductase-like aldo/keto reductase
VEHHPYLQQRALLSYCASRGIRVMAYSPLGSASGKKPAAHGCALLEHEVVLDVSKKLKKTAAQVLVKWALGKGVVPLPKSVSEERIRTNADVDGWELESADVAALDGLECGCRNFRSYVGEGWYGGERWVEKGDDRDLVQALVKGARVVCVGLEGVRDK